MTHHMFLHFFYGWQEFVSYVVIFGIGGWVTWITIREFFE